jgi:hypothetical protein
MKPVSTLKYLSLASLFVAGVAQAKDDQTTDAIRKAAGAILNPDQSAAGASNKSAEQAIAGWKAKPKEAAQKLISKYGQPSEITSQRLIWHNNSPWKMTEIVNEEIEHDFPIPHTDFLKQTIDFRVSPEKFSDLAQFDGSVIVERTKGELSARCDKEENNILALNLAQDVAKGTKSVSEARDFFTKTISAAMKGEKPAYMQSLQFSVAKAQTGDPDTETTVNEAAGTEQKKNDQK